MTLTMGDLRSKLPSDLSGSQSIGMSRSASARERRWWQIHRSISNSEDVIDENLDEIDVPEKGAFFCLTWPERSTVDLNRPTRTPLDFGRPKLSVGLCREALSHSGARWRGGGGNHPPQVRSRSAKKEVQASLSNGLTINGTSFSVNDAHLWFTGLRLPRFTCTDATADVLWACNYEKGVVEVVGVLELFW